MATKAGAERLRSDAIARRGERYALRSVLCRVEDGVVERDTVPSRADGVVIADENGSSPSRGSAERGGRRLRRVDNGFHPPGCHRHARGWDVHGMRHERDAAAHRANACK
ncbi:MAG: hypothetical protein M3O46_16200 [Myxococcota bacterium]|nr:hypothetical protein [Myxococcota bacterium]